MNILLFATAWGPLHGGVNAFNRPLAAALAARLGRSGSIYCAVPAPDAAAMADALEQRVTLVPILGKAKADRLDSSWVLDVQEALDALGKPDIDLCIGHDVTSGEIAVRAGRLLGGRSAIIHHMDYRSYHGAKGEPERTDALSREQAQILGSAELLFAVGPLLAESAGRQTGGREVVELIPGLEPAPDLTSSDSLLEAVTFGRFDAGNRIIKQAGLAAAGFGRAMSRAHEGTLRTALDGAPLYVVGVESAEDKRALNRLAEKAAGRVVNLLPLPFTVEPGAVMSRLAGCNAALVLSWHEGFSLAAWEAIAAGTPLVLTRNSGAFRLIDRDLHGSGLGCVKVVDIQGRRDPPHFTSGDEAAVAQALLEIARDIPRAKADAATLRDLVRSRIGATWENAAGRVLDAFSSRPGAAGQAGSARPPVWIPPLTPRDVRATTRLENPLTECVTMTISPTQGSHALAYDLTPEVRFGRYELSVDGVDVTCALRRADLTLTMEGCEIPHGPRLGDNASTAPHLIAEPPSRWRIEGPLEGGFLARRALGEERLCAVRMNGTEAVVTLTVSCRAKDLSVQIAASKWPKKSPAQDRVMKVFLTKCLAGGGGDANLLLSRASVQLQTDSE